ncbi:hypothetical protein CMT41_07295 [Colwellia sp. MT41]|uniref:Excisionase n=1 Tax=Colwellia marinimaniae TaxID=1513592 RepID=A0ABQ0MYK4_9GAMM|nr:MULTISPECIES: excisionase [Colwellia]ALO34542.1 hypothetical protein CMT41_07295 [Colwellia sp. MT41]GAW97458.1 excisionase [Colwellia marinimaniae]
MKLITLEDWAGKSYDVHFSMATLTKWSREGLINPAPKKIGNRWLVHPDAKYVEKTIEAQRTDHAQNELKENQSSNIVLNDKILRIINNDSKAA